MNQIQSWWLTTKEAWHVNVKQCANCPPDQGLCVTWVTQAKPSCVTTCKTLIDWLTDWLIDWQTDRQKDRQTDWLAGWLADWLTGGLTDRIRSSEVHKGKDGVNPPKWTWCVIHIPANQWDHFSWQVNKSHWSLHSQVPDKNPTHTCVPEDTTRKQLVSKFNHIYIKVHVKLTWKLRWLRNTSYCSVTWIGPNYSYGINRLTTRIKDLDRTSYIDCEIVRNKIAEFDQFIIAVDDKIKRLAQSEQFKKNCIQCCAFMYMYMLYHSLLSYCTCRYQVARVQVCSAAEKIAITSKSVDAGRTKIILTVWVVMTCFLFRL